MRIFTSVSIEWPSWSALAAAISSEIAMSPATYGTADGKVRTSVGLFFLRKHQFSDCISRFEVMQMFTSPLIPRARCMRVAKRLKLSALVAFDCVLVCLTSLNERMGGLIALPEYGSKDLFGNAIPRVESADRRNFSERRFAVGHNRVAIGRTCQQEAVPGLQIERQLLIAPLIVFIGPDDPLHQVVTHHIAFVEAAEANALDIFQHFHGLKQTAAAGVGQVDLVDVSGN